MSEKSIILNPEMINATLDDRKTQTRRLNGLDAINENPDEWSIDTVLPNGQAAFNRGRGFEIKLIQCPYGQVGDRLWVREGYKIDGMHFDSDQTSIFGIYLADNSSFDFEPTEEEDEKIDARKYPFRRTPGRFMYRSLSRITLEITGIRVERLQDISEADAKAEGVIDDPSDMGWDNWYGVHFRKLWEKINAKKHPWSDNPWVWVITFRRIRP